MKRILYMAAALLAAAACSREPVISVESEENGVEPSGPILVTLIAGDTETRTELGRDDQNVLKTYWSHDDDISLIRVPNLAEDEGDFEMDEDYYYIYHPFAGDVAGNRSPTAKFSGSVDNAGQYRAVYPQYLMVGYDENYWVGWMAGDGDESYDSVPGIYFFLPSVQNPSATSFDKAADVMVSAPFNISRPQNQSEGPISVEDIQIAFTRVNAILRIKFHIPQNDSWYGDLAGQKVRKVTIGQEGQGPDGMMAPARTRAAFVDNEGEVRGLTGLGWYGFPICPATGDFNVNRDDQISLDVWEDGNGYVVAEYTDDDSTYEILSTDPDEATYLVVFPTILKNSDYDDREDGLPVCVETDQYVITRVVNLPREIALQPGVVTTLNISLSSANSEREARQVLIEKSQITLIPGDSECMALYADNITFPDEEEIEGSEDFASYFTVTAVNAQNQDCSNLFSLKYVSEEEYGDYGFYTSCSASSVEDFLLQADPNISTGTYDVTIWFDGQYPAQCRVTVIDSSDPITFEDPDVKAICIEEWGRNLVPGEFTKYEASRVTSLGYAFKDQTTVDKFNELVNFTGLTTLESAFSGCTNLVEVCLPSGFDGNMNWAFYQCENLKSFTFPAHFNHNSEYAFKSCLKLERVELSVDMGWISPYAFDGCVKLETVVIPEGSRLKKVCEKAFQSCKLLGSIDLPEAVERIDNYAFYGCSELTSIDLPGALNTLGYNAFKECEKLASVTIPGGVSRIQAETFRNCKLLETVVLNEGLTKIEGRAFDGCSSLHQIVFPASLQQISGYYPFGEGGSVQFYSGNGYDGVTFLGQNPPAFDAGYLNSAIVGKRWDENTQGWIDGVTIHVPEGRGDAYSNLNITNGYVNVIVADVVIPE